MDQAGDGREGHGGDAQDGADLCRRDAVHKEEWESRDPGNDGNDSQEAEDGVIVVFHFGDGGGRGVEGRSGEG